MKIKIYIVAAQGAIDLVTSSYEEAVAFVSDETLDRWGQVNFYRKLMNEFGTKPDEYIETFEVEVPKEAT